MSDVAVVVYGATGFTGRLVCAELARREVRVRRRRSRPGEADGAGGVAGKAQPEVLVAALDDARRWKRRSRADASYSTAPARSRAWASRCARRRWRPGAHYLDITGEIELHAGDLARDAEARRRGVALVNAVGFDVVPTDAAAVLAAEAGGRQAGASAHRHSLRRTRDARDDALGARAGGQGRPGVHRRASTSPSRSRPIAGTRRSRRPSAIACACRSRGAIWRRRRARRARAPSAPTWPCRRRRRGWRRWSASLGKALGMGAGERLAERWVSTLPEGPSDAERARARCAVVAEAQSGAQARRARG